MTTAVNVSTELEIVVASLRRATDRRRRVMRMLEGTDRRWRLFDACTEPLEDIPYDERRTLIEKGRPLSRTELATCATHYGILRQFVESGETDFMLVLEDDVFIDPGFWFERLPDLMRRGGIDMLRLYSRFLTECRRIARVSERHTLVRFKRPVFGAQAYVVSREGARRLLQPIRRIVRPCDDEFDRFWDNGLPLYALYPFPVIELESPTTITGRDEVKHPLTTRQRVLCEINRRWTKHRRHTAHVRMKVDDLLVKGRLRGAYYP